MAGCMPEEAARIGEEEILAADLVTEAPSSAIGSENAGRLTALVQIWMAGGPDVLRQKLLMETAELGDRTSIAESGGGGKINVTLVSLPMEGDLANPIRGVVRCRPCMGLGAETCISLDGARCSIERPGDGIGPKSFEFTAVFDGTASQQQMYDDVGAEMVQHVLEGFSATVMAYGQTGSGKRHSLFGPKPEPDATFSEDGKLGLVPRAAKKLMQAAQSRVRGMRWQIACSYVQIRNEQIFDLLSPQLRECGVQDVQGKADIKGCAEVEVTTKAEFKSLYTLALSRSYIEPSNRTDLIFRFRVQTVDSLGCVVSRILTFVKCKGSERQSKAGAEGMRLREGVQIGMSLSALGNVISSLADRRCRFIPYRDSKLTRLLEDSLGGPAKTVFLAHISPESCCCEESLSTLRYANRAATIGNRPLAMNCEKHEIALLPFQEWLASAEQGPGPEISPAPQR
ncbi:Kif3b [Symbiodinium natans]|uniref:Kif3b protein n=1 Tax=Symbiodinium natans TaxID=878477 RepID=A0A812TPA5_9DINO|nr:Kif3b [Symbiodinium natans]CAE7559538.1 Kif3b [Symbiodinium natans]